MRSSARVIKPRARFGRCCRSSARDSRV